MALFDPERKRIVLRIVYDGPGFAGKTTNLRRLSESLAAWRRSELVSPSTMGERTQYFDWLEVDGGLLRSYPVRAQLLTVPGQRELTLRRKFVLERADVVVFVADSQPESVAEARTFYAELCEQLAGLPETVPIVFQANKQDLPGAMAPSKLVRAVTQGLRKPDQLRGCVAANDRGVRQTLNLALRLGSRALRERVAGKSLDALTRTRDPGSAAATYAALTHSEAERARRSSASASAPASLDELSPEFPSPDLPSTHLWPPVTGRALLESLAEFELRPRSDPAMPERISFEAGGYRLHTDYAVRYADEDTGVRELWQLTRRKVALASWLPEPCAIALAPDRSGAGVWRWTVEPILPTLAESLSASDPDLRREALVRFAEATVGALALAETHGLHLDLEPGAFAVQTGDRPRTRYVGERLEAGDALPDLASAIAGPLAAVGDDELALADFTESLCIGLHHAPSGDQARAAIREDLLARATGTQLGTQAAARALAAAARVLATPARA